MAKQCIITESTFFDCTRPAQNSARPGKVMNRTSAVDVKIQAMLPPLSHSAMAVPGRS